MLTLVLPPLALDPEEELALLLPLLLDELPQAASRAAPEIQARTTEMRRRWCIASTTFLAESLD
jgi:hypothetical protein